MAEANISSAARAREFVDHMALRAAVGEAAAAYVDTLFPALPARRARQRVADLAILLDLRAGLPARQYCERYICVETGSARLCEYTTAEPVSGTRHFLITPSGDIYEVDPGAQQRRWLARLRPEAVLPPLEDGVEPIHKRRDQDAGQMEWHDIPQSQVTWQDE